MREQPLQESVDGSKFKDSRVKSKKKEANKPSPFEINIQNYLHNIDASLQRVDPKGISANAIYVSFTGVIQSAELFSNYSDIQVSYRIQAGPQWYDQTPEISDHKGISTFCEVKNKQVTFSLGFDRLMSCMYLISWPQIVMTFKGFNFYGQLITIGYAQVSFPMSSGMQLKQSHIFGVVQNMKWYHKWFPFLQPDIGTYNEKDFEKIITKAQGRQLQKVKTVGRVTVRCEILTRNLTKFGYK